MLKQQQIQQIVSSWSTIHKFDC